MCPAVLKFTSIGYTEIFTYTPYEESILQMKTKRLKDVGFRVVGR